MASEDEVRTAPKKIRRYQSVASVLKNTLEYTKTKELARQASMAKEKFEGSISKARLFLALKGIIIVNRVSKKNEISGYKVGSYDELLFEVEKACQRARAQLGGMAKRISYLQISGKIEQDLQPLIDLMSKNLNSIDHLIKNPDMSDVDEFEDFEEFEAIPHPNLQITPPDFIKNIPDELVDSKDLE